MTTSPRAPGTAPGVLALHREGRLAADYPLLGPALAEADDDELARAGRLLTRISPDDVLDAHPGLPTLSVAVTGHGTVAPLEASLSAEAARHGIVLRTELSPYDAWIFDLTDPGSDLYAARPDLTLCVLDPMVIFDEVPTPWGPDEVRQVWDAKLRLVERIAVTFADAGSGTLVVNTVPLLRTFTAQLLDLRSRARLGAVWREANARLLRLAEEHPALVVLDLDPLAAEVPAHDTRLSAYARAHLSPALLARYAREAVHLARHLAGRTKKALVLDLDGTVWGGTLGDDGPEGIEAEGTPRGEAFAAFQRTARQLASQGVLLAAVSKNDLAPVQEVLRDHPGMTLTEDDFVRVLANWRPKHLNLTDLANDLNVSADSFVFADDSPYECGLVARELPGVAVVRLNDEPAQHVERLLHDGWFDTRELTAEDRARPARYREELERQDFSDGFDSLEGYLSELGVTVDLRTARDADVPRLSQITLRTNQFNLTTARLQPPDVEAWRKEPGRQVLTVRSADRFGDNGLVGALFLRSEDDVTHIDNFLLSCRVFSRGIETACLSAVLAHAQANGARAVHGHYRPSNKNGKVADLYPRHGFSPLATPDDPPETATGGGPGATAFRHVLETVPPQPDHVRLSTGIEGSDQ
ncbi:HAD-IIIC family phosphatase [Streptomyces sp. NPDC026589]|uniref:HAD-IIIC family phosphatase n=1 Tax=Streptomyces sp. NPDC026589 TaxID=3155609 RepID=UPI0033DCB51D